MVSRQFHDAVAVAVQEAINVPDDAIVYMLTGWGNQSETVPLYLDTAPNQAQQAASGCTNCTFLGLWADKWPGYDPAPHGMIWLFESGIGKLDMTRLPSPRPTQYLDAFIMEVGRRHGPLVAHVCDVLIHEMGHALQRDHVLDAMENARAGGLILPQPAACGVCPGRM